MKVRATKTGFYKGDRIRKGKEFHIPDGAKLAKWMEPCDKAIPKPAEPEPDTFAKFNAKNKPKAIKSKPALD